MVAVLGSAENKYICMKSLLQASERVKDHKRSDMYW